MDHNGPPSSLDPLVANHRAFVRFVERRVGDPALAEDIVQDAFSRAVTHGGAVPDETAVAWFYRVLRNAVVDHYRRHEARRKALELLARELDGAVPAPEVQNELCRCVMTAASGLKPEYADALRRVDVDGAPVREFAAQAGISTNNASVRLFRAREALKRQVIAACGVCAEHGCIDCTCGPRKPDATLED